MEGMKDIVASVSGYHGSERFNLIKLISLSGASYVGNLSRSTTHLVCWKFDGEKYKLAKKFGTKIVNHRWFEDCIKEGKRASEQPYTWLSGQQVGSVTLEVPAVSEVGVLRENKSVLNGVHKSHTDPVIDIEYENTEHHDWDDRWLLNKHEESSKSVSNPSRKQKKRIHDGSRDIISTDPPRTSRRLVKMCDSKYPMESLTNNGKAGTSNHFSLRNENEARISGRSEDASTSQRRARNHGSSANAVVEVLDTRAKGLILQTGKRVTAPERALQDSSSAPPRTSRRLVKLSANKYPMESLADNGKECLTTEILNVDQNVATTSNHFCLRNENEARINGRSEDASTSQRRARNHGSSDNEGVEVLDTHAKGLIVQTEKRVTAPERALQDTSSDAQNAKEEQKIVDPDEPARSPRSPIPLDLSCVICWTEFSSTRGVLPCGHRFCFLCIQTWADSMVSKGKTSTCPLCKSSFTTITKVDDADCADQRIYSQTIPCPLSTQDIFILPDGLPVFGDMQVPSEPACCQCNSREPEDLLIQCDVCHIRCIHCYCLDPPLFPWMCNGCKDMRMLYPRF